MSSSSVGGNDPGWHQVPWADCGLEVAEHPEAAVPPLVWEDCVPASPGCSLVAPAFVTDTSGQNHGMVATSLLDCGAYRIGVIFERSFNRNRVNTP